MSEVIDHVGIRFSDLPTSRLFGRGESDDFCLHTVGSKPGRDRVTTGAHIAFRAGDDVRSCAGTALRGITAGRTSDPLACGPSTAAATTLRSSSIPTANVGAVFHTPTDFVAEQ